MDFQATFENIKIHDIDGDDGDDDENGNHLHCISDEQNHHSVPKCQLEFLNPSHASEIKIQLILFHEIRIEI